MKYIKPELEIIKLKSEDIITVSREEEGLFDEEDAIDWPT